MSLEEVASWILRFAQVEPSKARNAYSCFLHIPGWEHLKFSPLIEPAKKIWNVSGAKYAVFLGCDHCSRKTEVLTCGFVKCSVSERSLHSSTSVV